MLTSPGATSWCSAATSPVNGSRLDQLDTSTIGNVPQSRDHANGDSGHGPHRAMGTNDDLLTAGERTRQGRSRAAGAIRLARADLIDWPGQLRGRKPGTDPSPPVRGRQVDNGPYRIINNNTVYIGSPASGATFHYRILHGDTLMLSPVLTKAMLRQALAHPQKFSAALWAVSVAYAGHTWKRVPCQSWCE